VEPVYCPNGHPNRPGTRVCAVCRALVPPSRPVAPPPVKSGGPQAEPSPAPRRAGIGYGLPALLLLLVVAAGLVALALRYPVRRADYLATAAVVTLPADAAIGALPTATPTASPPPAPPTATPPPAPTADPNASPTPVLTITPLATIVGIVLAPTTAPEGAAVSPNVNLIQNGDFTQEWVNGWERATEGLTGVVVVETRPPGGDRPQPTLYMSKLGAGALRVVQHVTLSGAAADLVFRGQLRLSGELDGAGNEGRAALLLLYEDADGVTLGLSAWLDGRTSGSGLWGTLLPTFGPTTAPRFQPAGWQTIEIDLGQEFTDRLPGLDPAAVRRVTVVLALLGSPGCTPSGCPAELEAAALSLTTRESAP
jgi:hypothetical protein